MVVRGLFWCWTMLASDCGAVSVLAALLLVVLLVYHTDCSAKRLNEYVRHYEELTYDVSAVQTAHHRAKRSLPGRDDGTETVVHVSFHAHNRHFRLRLRRDVDVFSDKLEIHGPVGQLTVDTSFIYHGHDLGEAGSTVFGSLIDGVFEGKIVSPKGSYYVEKAHRYFPHTTHPNRTFHSVIYHEDHVEDPYRDISQGHTAGCGITEEVSKWMDRIQNSGVDDDDFVEADVRAVMTKTKSSAVTSTTTSTTTASATASSSGHVQSAAMPPTPQAFRSKQSVKANHEKRTLGVDLRMDSAGGGYKATFPNKYSKEANERHHARQRRATRRDDNKNTCSLFIQTDPLIWRHIREGFPEHNDPRREKEINEKTREEILSLIAHHVTAVNYIYRDTKFDGRNEHRNIKFEVQRIKIDDDTSCKCHQNLNNINNRNNNNVYTAQEHYYNHNGHTNTQRCGEVNQFCMENIDVSNFLNIHSLGNHEDFCLAYVFTYRDFTGGTLGLAWVASASGASGGICEKYKTYTETIGGMYQSTKRSLNTGIITFVNYNSRVPPKVSQLTLAHEIGHNFGSPHDYPSECRPGGLNGNYIMFASATSGDRPNNSKFSGCSVGNISSVLDAIGENKKRNCFTVSAGAFCGNKIVEEGEECDCGYDENECQEKCCYPRTITADMLLANSTAAGCKRRRGTQCSPSQGPCCNGETCRFVAHHAHAVCRTATDCAMSAQCDGRTAECPAAQPLPDKTRCNNGTQLCIAGECSGSICLEWNLQACSINTQEHPNIDKRKLCELACQNGTDVCRSTSEFADKVGLPPGGISLRPGSPCDNFQGYCDVFLKCRAVDADGPLVRLMNLLLNRETLLSVAQWITEYWWAVLLMGITFIIFMGLFIKCCAVHTPSSNPKKPPARSITDTLRRPMNTLRRMRHPHAGRGAPHTSGHHGRSRNERSSRPSASHSGSRGGYGEGRGHYYPPKATAPPVHHYPSGAHHNARPHSSSGSGQGSSSSEPYAGAYDRNAYEMRHKV